MDKEFIKDERYVLTEANPNGGSFYGAKGDVVMFMGRTSGTSYKHYGPQGHFQFADKKASESPYGFYVPFMVLEPEAKPYDPFQEPWEESDI